MNLTTTLTTLTSLTAAALLWAAPPQETLQPAQTPLTAGGAVAEFDAGAWAQALRAPGLAQRKASYGELVVAARSSDEILEELRTWAADESDVELAWTAHLMLRELRAGARSAPLGRRGLGTPFWGGAHPLDLDAFDRLFDGLRQRDPLRGFGGQLFGPGAQNPFQLDLDAFGPGSSQQSSGMSLELGPEGVKLRTEETVDGETETRTYEAESLEALLEAHPELADKIGTGGGAFPQRMPRRGGLLDTLDDWRRPRSLRGSGPQGLRPVEPSLERLGIQMLPPEARTQTYAGVADDVGLQVVEVLPGSLAEALGLRVGELVISLDGRALKSAQDVRTALDERAQDAAIEVECVDEAGQLRVRSWRPSDTTARDRTL